MGVYGGFYKGDKKKLKKSLLEKKAQKQLRSSAPQVPQVEVIRKGKQAW